MPFYVPEQDFYNWDAESDIDMRRFTADFETTTDPDDCRVWAFAVCNIDNIDDIVYGNTIEGFFAWLRDAPRCAVYFRNLAFDGAFMFDHMLKIGWEWVEADDEGDPYTFTTVISDMNQLYCIRLTFPHGKVIEVYDSLKIIPLSIKATAKAFGLPIAKGEIDYSAPREVGHELTEDEMYYIRNDVQIDAMAMKVMLSQGMTKMTAGSNALADYKTMCGGNKRFRLLFPIISIDEDSFIRQAYRGGFTYVNPKYAGLELGIGMSFDVNSLYPSVMAACDGQRLPYGVPVYFEGEPDPTDELDIWVAQVSFSFRVKDGHIPCIQMKNNLSFVPTEYITDSKGPQVLTVTSVDWALICEQYDVSEVVFMGGYYFHSSKSLFIDYVNKWTKVKNEATIEGNSGMRQIAKLMLNSLYGKFATQPTVCSRKPELKDGVVRYVDLDPEERDPVYLPVGVFITAYARSKTIRAAQSCGERFVYSDTDSIKILGTEEPDIDVDPVRLGAWKNEGTFTRIKALRPKTYICEMSEDGGKLTVHVAGMPERCHASVTFDNFKIGAEYDGKLYTYRVPGGIVLKEGPIVLRG